jgi:DNA-binding response OmpR family regulator
MNAPGGRKRILLIDPQDFWRVSAARALEAAGFSVCQASEYSPSSGQRKGPPDLVVLGCANVGAREQRWIQGIVTKHWPLLVLSASLPWEVMRSVFVAGADDVTEKPYDPEHLVTIIDETLKTIADRHECSSVLRRQAQ